MKLTPDVLVPVLLILLVVNLVLILGAIIAGRRNRARADVLARPPERLASIATASDPTAVDADPSPADALPAMPATTLAVGGRDALTGLHDAATWARLLDDEDPRVKRYHRPVTIALVELDGLDRLTAKLGVEAGNRLLPAMADTLRRLAREADHVARLGPGRFGVLLPETDEVAVINYLERVRRACDLWLESGAISLRLAIGWAATSGDLDLLEVERIAAERMYEELRRNARRDGIAEPATPAAPATTPTPPAGPTLRRGRSAAPRQSAP